MVCMCVSWYTELARRINIICSWMEWIVYGYWCLSTVFVLTNEIELMLSLSVCMSINCIPNNLYKYWTDSMIWKCPYARIDTLDRTHMICTINKTNTILIVFDDRWFSVDALAHCTSHTHMHTFYMMYVVQCIQHAYIYVCII